MRLIGTLLVVLVLAAAAAGGYYIYTNQGPGQGTAALSLVERQLDTAAVSYDSLRLEGRDRVVAENLSWRDPDGGRGTARRLVVEDLRPRALEVDVAFTAMRDAWENASFTRRLGIDTAFQATGVANPIQPLWGAIILEEIELTSAANGPRFEIEEIRSIDLRGRDLDALQEFGTRLEAMATAAASDGFDPENGLTHATLAHPTLANPTRLGAEFARLMQNFTFDEFVVEGVAVSGIPDGTASLSEFAMRGYEDGALRSFRFQDLLVEAGIPSAAADGAPALGQSLRLSFEEVEVEGLSMAEGEIMLNQVAAAMDDPARRLPDPAAYERAGLSLYTGMGVDAFEVIVPGALHYGIPKMDLSADWEGRRHVSGYEMEMFIDVAGLAATGPQVIAQTQAAPSGIAAFLATAPKTRFDMVMGGRSVFDTENRTITLEDGTFTIMDLLTFTSEMKFADYGYLETLEQVAVEVEEDQGPDPMSLLMQGPYADMKVDRVELSLTDLGALDLFFAEWAARNPEVTAAQLRQQGIVLAAALGEPFSAPLSSFIQNGGKLTFTAKPDSPVGMEAFQALGPGVFNIGMTHEAP